MQGNPSSQIVEVPLYTICDTCRPLDYKYTEVSFSPNLTESLHLQPYQVQSSVMSVTTCTEPIILPAPGNYHAARSVGSMIPYSGILWREKTFADISKRDHFVEKTITEC